METKNVQNKEGCMKVGILSMQRVINYGSFLQAYALKKIIEGLGHEAYFVDIKKGEQLALGKKKDSPESRVKFFELPKRIEHVLYAKKRNKLFRNQLFEKYGINLPKEEHELNFLVVGSDEVFNCLQHSSWGLSLQLLGKTSIPSISYAASCGYTTYDKLQELGITGEIADSLKQFNAISVRDKNTANVVKTVSGVEPLMHLDPVLVYDWKKETDGVDCKFKDYILVYGYDNRINDVDEINAIKKFAKEHGKKLISFGVYQRWCDKNVLCDPFQLVKYFMMADYVITETFHGTVLSIKCNKQFAAIVRDSNRNKMMDLLSKFGLEGRASEITRLNNVLETPIDYSTVNEIVKKERERAIDYLNTNIPDRNDVI